MASPNTPPSSAALILRYSKTRVRVPSKKRYVVSTRLDAVTGAPIHTFSRELNRVDCIGLLIKKFG